MIVQPPTRCRWFPRFGLRTLLIAITVICILLGGAMLWYRAQEAEFNRQQEMAAQLRVLGAHVVWMQQTPGWLAWAGESPIFQRVTIVQCGRPGADMIAILDLLRELPTATHLLSIHWWDDDVVTRLSQLKHLRMMGFTASEQIDAELKYRRETELHRQLPGISVQWGNSFKY